MYIYYIHDPSINVQLIDNQLVSRCTLVRRRPLLRNVHNFLWGLISFFSFRVIQFYEYVYLLDNQVVASAQVINKLPIFRFMKRVGDLHIGPCRTEGEFRGNGLYPSLLQKIVADFPQRQVYIFCEETNISSIKGIQKSGFRPFAKGRKTKMGFYIITETIKKC